MMTSNLDILSFLKADQDTRAKEKEEDKETRAKERQEDMEHIVALIQRGVQKEVRAAIQPIEERLVAQEIVNQELTRQFNSVVKEVDLLKKALTIREEFPALSLTPKVSIRPEGGRRATGGRSEENRIEWSRRQDDEQEDYTMKSQELCASARRVVGFSPIGPRMLELQKQSYGAKDTEEAMLMEVKSYLKCEMKMKPSDIETLDFVNISPPAKENWNVLYVKFGSDYQVDKVFSHTRNMVKQDHRVVRWYPRQMYERYRAVESIAYDIRKNQKLKTRVKIGRVDIELSTREVGSTIWRRKALPDNLPKLELTALSPALPSSPPPGRPGRPMWKKNASGEDVLDQSEVENPEEVSSDLNKDNVANEAATAQH